MSEDKVRDTLQQNVLDAKDLREVELLPVTAGPAEVREHLIEVRGRLDRIEELLVRTIRVRGAVHRRAVQVTAEAEESWDYAITRQRNAPVRRGDEYSSAKERHAEANLAVLDERRAAREANDLAHFCDEAVEQIRIVHRGLDGVRHDALTILRTLVFESTLER